MVLNIFSKILRRKVRNPEADFTVNDDGVVITVISPDVNLYSIAWNELTKVEVQTNDTGPSGMDVWFNLKTNKIDLSFPLGATGANHTISSLEKLPGFQMKGMNCTENKIFVCWE